MKFINNSYLFTMKNLLNKYVLINNLVLNSYQRKLEQ